MPSWAMSSPEPHLPAGRAGAPGTAGAIHADEPTSVDAFYDGRFALVQPRRAGYRSGLDALLVAATLPRDATGRAIDLGAGAGAVGLAACCRNPAVTMRLVESQPLMAALARRTLELPQNVALAGRVAVVEGDLLAGRADRERMGLSDGAFDHVLTNPPFYPDGHRPSPDPLRAGALTVAGPGSLGRWIAVSAALLRHGGSFAAILRTDAVPTVLVACAGRLGAMRLVPVHTRFGEMASRVLLLARKGSSAPFAILPALVLRDAGNRPTDLLKAIETGAAELPPR